MSAETRPNILYIMTDQQRFDTLSVYGLTACKTPRLDELAAGGVRFDRAYTVCSLCSPARASMLTGLYPHGHRMWNNNDMMQWALRDLPDDVRLISQPLGAAGYQCGYVGKWHCGQTKVPSTYGFVGMDVPNYGNPYGTEEYKAYLARTGLERPERKVTVTDFTARRTPMAGELIGDTRACATYFLAEYAIDLIRRFSEDRRSDGRPWMLFLSFWLPHHPNMPPTEYLEQYSPDEIELWPNFHDTLEGKPPNQRRYRESFHRALEHGEDTWREIIRRYFAQVTCVDAQIGRVLDALTELGLQDETAVMFSTDHGDMCGSHGKFHDKDAFMYEELYHIPLLVRWPGVTTAGTVRREFVTNTDLAATALDIAGLDVPEEYHGRSLAPILRGGEVEWADDVYCEYHGHRFLFSQRMVRWDKYKYVFNAPSFDELYDLDADPYELDNRIGDSALADVAEEGRARIMKWIEATGDDLRAAASYMIGDQRTTP